MNTTLIDFIAHSSEQIDKGCKYKEVCCKECQSVLGRFYLQSEGLLKRLSFTYALYADMIEWYFFYLLAKEWLKCNTAKL